MDYPGKVITKTQVTPTQTSASGNWTLDDQAAAIKNNNWPVALVPNPISKSLRFNSADSAYLNRTPATTSNQTTWTWSGWVKRGKLGVIQALFGTGSSTGTPTQHNIYFSGGDTLFFEYWNGSTNYYINSSQLFRDPSAWYHIVAVWDTTQGTSSNRMKLYVNGSQITALSGTVYPSSSFSGTVNTNVAHYIGAFSNTGKLDGYLTEINFIDGQALTPSSFGMTNPQTGQWIPLKYSGTYGTNGFYLNFKDATSTTTLGYDYSGNANNWTTNNFSVTAGAGNDSLTDVPTPWFAYNTTGDVGGVIRGNYCTANPLKKPSTSTITNGNLDVAHTSAGGEQPATFAFSSGKWYWEVSPNSVFAAYGIIPTSVTPYASSINNGYHYYGDNGQFYTGTSGVAYGATFTSGDVIGVALNLDTNQITFYKNGVSQGAQSISAGEYNPDIAAASTNTTNCNFGQRPFAYTPPTGFRSLCTTNLPATAIGFGPTNQADDYMNVVLYTGNSTARSITGVGFQPDFTWIKMRSGASNHALFDSVRGATQWLASNLTQAETTDSVSLTSFDSDGFSLGTGANLVAVNNNTSTFAAWNWKAGGTGVSNTAGTITSTVSANTTSGFSIATLTAQSSGTGTFGHGLGVAPSMVIVKQTASAGNWVVYHTSIGNGSYIVLNTTAASVAAASYWNSTSPSSTVVTLGTAWATAGSVVAYCFAAVPGYSAFGSYTGNGSTDGPFVYTGFRPRWLLIKNSNRAVAWWLVDTVRNPSNVVGWILQPNVSTADVDSPVFDILSNGFKVRTTDQASNFSGETIIYAAFAEFPFQFANAR